MAERKGARPSGKAKEPQFTPRGEDGGAVLPTSDVHRFLPTPDPNFLIRVRKDVTGIAFRKDWRELVTSLVRRFGDRQFQIDDLSAEQKDDKADLETATVATNVLGFVILPTEDTVGVDFTSIPQVKSLTVEDEQAFRDGNLALYQQVTDPESLVIVRVPDGFRGNRNKPVTAEMVQDAVTKSLARMGVVPNQEDGRGVKIGMERELGITGTRRDILVSELVGGAQIPGVKATIARNIDAKPIPLLEPRPQEPGNPNAS